VKECANELAGARTTPKTYPTLNTFILIHLRQHSMQKVCVKLAKIESLSLAAKEMCHLLREIIIGRSNPTDRATAGPKNNDNFITFDTFCTTAAPLVWRFERL
jgi:hypothetical protein